MLGSSTGFLFLLPLTLFLSLAHGAPIVSRPNHRFSIRSAETLLAGPMTFTTTDVVQTSVGPMVENCSVTLTPITGPNGDALVREEKDCTLTPAPSNSSPLAASSIPSAVSTTPTVSSPVATTLAASSSAVPTQPVTTFTFPGSVPTSSPGSSAASGSAAAASPSGNPAISVNGFTSVAVSIPPTSSASSSVASLSPSSPTPAPALSGGSTAISVNGFSSVIVSSLATDSTTSASAAAPTTPAIAVSGLSASSLSSSTSATPTVAGAAEADATPSGTAAADSTTSSAAAFVMPGKKLSVLPIGLGVFAGISIIALIVVGLVTYERTKYRKTFRERKLAEQGANMGYGGMAQAT